MARNRKQVQRVTVVVAVGAAAAVGVGADTAVGAAKGVGTVADTGVGVDKDVGATAATTDDVHDLYREYLNTFFALCTVHFRRLHALCTLNQKQFMNYEL